MHVLQHISEVQKARLVLGDTCVSNKCSCLSAQQTLSDSIGLEAHSQSYVTLLRKGHMEAFGM